MQNDYKKRIENAMSGYHKKNLPKKPRKKSNGSPEGKLVLELKRHLQSLGWSMSVIESKAVYNKEAGRYMSGKAEIGYPDLSGNTPDGIAVFIEVKAKGRRGAIRPDQREFLLKKIETNCFAICTDSIEHIDRVFNEWVITPLRKHLLLADLPALASHWGIDDGPLFDE